MLRVPAFVAFSLTFKVLVVANVGKVDKNIGNF